MNRFQFNFLLYALSVTGLIFSFSVTAQKTSADTAKYLSLPGPANQDTSRFATFYIIRPDGELAKRSWLGIYFDDTLMVRVDNNMRYVIKYVKTGEINIWAKNELRSSLTVNTEPGKKYYIKMEMEPGGKLGNPKLTLLVEKEGEEAFNKIEYPPLYVYDPDPGNNSGYIWPVPDKAGYASVMFSLPLSTRHYIAGPATGFIFSYYNKIVSPTFSELDGVYGGKINLTSKEDFEKFVNKQINNLKKGFKKSETLKEITRDSLTSHADYISSFYFVTEDSKPEVLINGNRPVLELRQYSTLLYKKDLTTHKGTFYSVYFSERGLPEELHTKKEIRFKILQLLNSCEFGDFK